MKVILTGYIKVASDDLSNVKKHLSTHIRLTKEEQGCIAFNVTQREENPCFFDVYEEFKDSISFSAHQERVENSAWGEATKNAERIYKITDLENE